MNRIKIQKLIDLHKENIKEAEDERHRKFIEFAKKARESCKNSEVKGREFEEILHRVSNSFKQSKEELKKLVSTMGI